MIDQVMIAAGSFGCVWVLFAKRCGWGNSLAPAFAAAVCGWIYSEVTPLALAIFLIFHFLANRTTGAQAQPPVVDKDVIDVEFEVRS